MAWCSLARTESTRKPRSMERDGFLSKATTVVTGASLGIGQACTELLLRRGGNVAMVARNPERLEAAARAFDLPDRIHTISADVTDVEAMKQGLRETAERFGRVDGLINNAGLHHRGPVRSRTAEELGAMVDVNLRAPVVLCRLALPYLEQAPRPFIVNVASLAGCLPLDGASTYSATKFGIRAFSLALGEELRDTPIRVSLVSPGPVSTRFILDEIDEVADITFSQTMCSPEAVADMVLRCAIDGKKERFFPAMGSHLATLSYLVPALRRHLRPRLEAKGRRVKARLKAQAQKSS